jgi:hypothetical protein
MNGKLSSTTYLIPDQMQMLNPALILVLLPIFNLGLYPLLRRCGVPTRPLQRMAVGLFLTAVAFVIAGCLELEVRKTYGIKPSANRSQINVMNSLKCPILLSINSASYQLNETTIAGSYNRIIYDLMPEKYVIGVTADPSSNCSQFNSTSLEVDVLDSEVRKSHWLHFKEIVRATGLPDRCTQLYSLPRTSWWIWKAKRSPRGTLTEMTASGA